MNWSAEHTASDELEPSEVVVRVSPVATLESVIFAPGTAAPLVDGLKEAGAAKIYATARDASSITLASVTPIQLDVTNAADIAAAAARLAVEEGLEFGPAKRQALKMLGLPGRTPLPSNEEVEAQVREHIAIFCAESQPLELAALRRHAVLWMRRMAAFRPHLGGTVWRGTATRLSDIYLQLFCDDAKSAEIALIDQRLRYQARRVEGFSGSEVDALSIHSFCAELAEEVGVHLLIYDYDDLRGALKPDGQGRAPRGDLAAIENLLQAGADA